MYVQHQQQQQQTLPLLPPSCQHQQAMQEYGDSYSTSYATGSSLVSRHNHRPQRPQHHGYMTPTGTGCYDPYPRQMNQGVAPNGSLADPDLDRSSIASGAQQYSCTAPPSANSVVYYGPSNHVPGSDWTQQHNDFICKETAGSISANACHQLYQTEDLTGVRRTITGSNGSFIPHQPDIRSSGTATNRHPLHSIATIQQGYVTHPRGQHLQPVGDGVLSVEDVLNTTGSRSSPPHSELSILGQIRGPQEVQIRRDEESGGGDGVGGGQERAIGPRSVNQNQVPFDWMKKQIYPLTPSSGKTRTKDKYRIVYSEHQKVELEKEFLYNPYITIQRKAELASIIGLSDRQVKIWFQNRRAKERKQKKKRPQATTASSNNHDAAKTQQQRHVISSGGGSGDQGANDTTPLGGVVNMYHQQAQQQERNGPLRGRVEGGLKMDMAGRCVLSDSMESCGEVKSESMVNL